MAHFKVFQNNRLIRKIELEGRDQYIGRRREADIQLDEPSVSRRHAKLHFHDGRFRVVDLKSANGTSVNGNQINHYDLVDGDKIEVGTFCLLYSEGPDTEIRVPTKAAPTPLTPPPADPAPATEADPAHQPPRTTTDAGRDLFTRAFPREGLGEAEQYDKLKALFGLSRRLGTKEGVLEVLAEILDTFLALSGAQRGQLLLSEEHTGELRPALTRTSGLQDDVSEICMTVAHKVIETGKSLVITDADVSSATLGSKSVQRQGIKSILCTPLRRGREILGVIYLDSQLRNKLFSKQDLRQMEAVANQASESVWYALERDFLKRDVKKLRTVHLERTLTEHNFENIIAADIKMKTVLAQVMDLAHSDTTTLLIGESGTGKELVAQAIHHNSLRREKPFVAVNCMALPEPLIESELFGHERGAFTGATERKVGRFELADGGTIFIDEVGELAQSIQVKLLRILQERNCERVGGTRTIPLDIRLIAATNCDLEAKIKDGSFREDLYYRLAVFTIKLPSLRERMRDIPPLIDYYIQHYNKETGKHIQGVSEEALKAFQGYPWPGNVRELKNVIERAFVLERTDRITPSSLPFGQKGGDDASRLSFDDDLTSYPTAFNEAKALFEKRFLLTALRRTGGNISATARDLGLPRNTIYRKIETYGLQPSDYES